MSRSMVMAADTGSLGGQVVTTETSFTRKSAIGSIKKDTPVSASRRLHILATMEMVKRWLGVVVQPVRMDVSGGWVCSNETRAFEIVLCPPYRVLAVKSSGVTMERGFAIRHCLSAPPTV